VEERRTNDDIEAIIQRAAKAAAKEALRDVGLSDDNAIHDMKELRDLLDSWREVRRSVAHTIVKIITVAVLGALVTGVWFKNWSQ
jgi:hypothetical protein